MNLLPTQILMTQPLHYQMVLTCSYFHGLINSNQLTSFQTVTRVAEKVPDVTPVAYDPSQDHGYQIALRHFLLKLNKSNTLYCALELHVQTSTLHEPPSPSASGSPPQTKLTDKPLYRVFIHTGTSKDLIKSTSNRPGIRQVYLLQTIAEAEALYQSLHNKYADKQGYRHFQLISPKIGSDLLSLSAYAGSALSISILPKSIQTLVGKVCNNKTIFMGILINNGFIVFRFLKKLKYKYIR